MKLKVSKRKIEVKQTRSGGSLDRPGTQTKSVWERLLVMALGKETDEMEEFQHFYYDLEVLPIPSSISLKRHKIKILIYIWMYFF